MRIKINLKSVLMYCVYALALVLLNSVLSGVPFSLGLTFAMLICGTNIIITPVLYVLASVITLDWVTVLLSLFECGFLTVITLIYRKTNKKIRFEAAIYLLISLAPFVAFSRWQGIDNLFSLDNPYVLKAIAAAAVLIFSFFCGRGVYSLLYRLYRCRLKADELLCLAVLIAAAGVGLRNIIGLYAYICLAAATVAFAVRLTRSPAAIIVAVVLSIPCAIVAYDLVHVTAFVLLATFALIFFELGRFIVPLAALSGGMVYLWFTGLFSCTIIEQVLYPLFLAVCCVFAAIPSDRQIAAVRDNLTIKRAIPRAEEERYMEYVSEKLFRMSEVFREIENAFTSLDDGPDDGAIKSRMLTELKEDMCAQCKRREICQGSRVYRGFGALIEAGCLKGKVSLVDLTSDVTLNCANPAALIDRINRLLYEYRKATLEAENARSGRKLLGGQARGIAEVLKSRAIELGRVGADFGELEKKLIDALTANGIACPEVKISGENNKEILVCVIDCKNPAAVKDVAENVTCVKLLLKGKRQYDGHKCTYVLCEPPKYDAAFGVAFAVKEGERVSGDTHSVIKINEHSFLMALSDGMGSGEYARRVSTTAISLIESFYKSEMPTEIVLDTINKLLCFNRDERFTCIDAAEINLNDLTASFIKVGSPVGMIVRKGEIKVLENHSLPLGILDNLHPATYIEKLKKDDVVVFMSDGVTSAFGGTAELYEFIGTLKPLNPQNLADNILEAAKSRVNGTPDDMTALCVRVFERN